MKPAPTVIVITGPTASGKSALAVDIASRLSTEIISADSRQIYQGIPIVTAMPTPEERAAVPHHLVDMLPLDAYYSASLFETDALAIASRLLRERGAAVLCGGSMMYVDAFCNGIDPLPTVPETIRQTLTQEWTEKGDDWLRAELLRVDPAYYARVDLHNLKRVFHAVEISRTANAPYSSLCTGHVASRPFRILKISLSAPRELLFSRINARVDQMLALGLEEEARRVYPLRHLNSLNTVGLKEMFAMFDGLLKPAEAIERIKKNTRVYAKKQITWFRRDPSIIYKEITEPNLADSVINLYRGK